MWEPVFAVAACAFVPAGASELSFWYVVPSGQDAAVVVVATAYSRDGIACLTRRILE